MGIEVHRDRNSEFEPTIIEKHQTRFDGFYDKIISMYARGMSKRDIQDHLKGIYHSSTVESAEKALEVFSYKWDSQYPTISLS